MLTNMSTLVTNQCHQREKSIAPPYVLELIILNLILNQWFHVPVHQSPLTMATHWTRLGNTPFTKTLNYFLFPSV